MVMILQSQDKNPEPLRKQLHDWIKKTARQKKTGLQTEEDETKQSI